MEKYGMRNGRVCEGAQKEEGGGGIIIELFKRVSVYEAQSD